MKLTIVTLQMFTEREYRHWLDGVYRWDRRLYEPVSGGVLVFGARG